MSVTKVSSAMQDLTDDYAFSGTVSGAGKVVQVVNVTNSAVASGTTVMVDDDSIPQKTEGIEWDTLAITPTHASNKLIIEASVFVHSSTALITIIMALFQDDTANALAASQFRENTALRNMIHLRHYMTAGTTSATTFKIRIGGAAGGTTTTGGHSGSTRVLGGVINQSITITEIKV